MWQSSKTPILTKLEKSKWDKNQKLKFWQNSNCDKPHKHKLWQNSKTQIVTKLKYSNCEKLKLRPNKKTKIAKKKLSKKIMIVAKLRNWKSDKSQKLKLWQN